MMREHWVHPATNDRDKSASCRGKIPYDSAGQAMQTLGWQRKRGAGGNMMPYRCQHCGRWHLGGKR